MYVLFRQFFKSAGLAINHADSPINGNLNHAIESALPIIRVVFSTRKVKIFCAGDEDDLISAAAVTITKALPKMASKPPDKLSNDKEYMRYLFTCVVNAFLRELDVLHGKSGKVRKRLQDGSHYIPPQHGNIRAIEAHLVLAKLPKHLQVMSRGLIRFGGAEKQACEYILQQLLHGREVSKSVLSMMRCKDKEFFTQYCRYLIYVAVKELQKTGMGSLDLFFVDPLGQPEALLFNEIPQQAGVGS